MAANTYTVTGMTCGHCVRAVRDEVGSLECVASVAADLASGRLTVTGDGYTDEQIREAVREAGYELR